MKKIYNGIRRRIRDLILQFRKRWVLLTFKNSKPASPEWLIGKEIQYGGLVTDVPRRKVSDSDPRSAKELAMGGMIGGDRMLHHGYASSYSKHLLPFASGSWAGNFVEVGILKGSGLAIWCDLFPKARVMGFDIDLSHTRENLPYLKSEGAFQEGEPELFEFDQFKDNRSYLAGILNGSKIEICVDDGLHSDESIMKTLASVWPNLADHFVYFVEDNFNIGDEIQKKYLDCQVVRDGELTVLLRG